MFFPATAIPHRWVVALQRRDELIQSFGGEQSAPWQLLVMTRAVANKDVRICIKRVSTTVLVSTHGTEVHLWKVQLVVMLRNHRSHKVSREINGSVNGSLRWFAVHFKDLTTYSSAARSRRSQS